MLRRTLIHGNQSPIILVSLKIMLYQKIGFAEFRWDYFAYGSSLRGLEQTEAISYGLKKLISALLVIDYQFWMLFASSCSSSMSNNFIVYA
jgi:hypothetical protein